jgi:hypothetical protein
MAVGSRGFEATDEIREAPSSCFFCKSHMQPIKQHLSQTVTAKISPIQKYHSTYVTLIKSRHFKFREIQITLKYILVKLFEICFYAFIPTVYFPCTSNKMNNCWCEAKNRCCRCLDFVFLFFCSCC